jgi:hypothetical protein
VIDISGLAALSSEFRKVTIFSVLDRPDDYPEDARPSASLTPRMRSVEELLTLNASVELVVCSMRPSRRMDASLS